jgi:hypothetical protein
MHRVTNSSGIKKPTRKSPIRIVDAEIHNWSLIDCVGGGCIIVGHVYSDSKKRFSDSTFVRTDLIVSIKEGIAETYNDDIYKLVTK